MIKILAFSGGISSLVVVNWFFRALFFASLFYDILTRVVKKVFSGNNNFYIIVRTLTCFLSLFGYWIIVKDYEVIRSTNYFNFLFLLVFFDIGYILKCNYTKIKNLEMTNIIKVLLPCVIFIMLVLLSNWRIELIDNKIVNPLFFVVSGICGNYLVFTFAILLKKRIRLVVIELGKNSVFIMVLHLLSFKLVTFAQIMIDNSSNYCVLSKPYPNQTNIWFLYVIIGLFLPWCVAKVYYVVKRKLFNGGANGNI